MSSFVFSIPGVAFATTFLDGIFEGYPPWKIVLSTAAFIHVVHATKAAIKALRSTDVQAAAFRGLRKIPLVQGKIDEELNKTVSQMENEVTSQIGDLEYQRTVPEKGWSRQKVNEVIDKCMALGKFKAEDGALSGTCHKQPDVERVLAVTEAFGKTAFANPLNPDAFPGIRKMEAEVVRMTCNLFHGHPDTSCGTMTSGGTESLILACKAYREYGKKVKGITTPNLVMSSSGHVGFDKGGEVLTIEVRHIPMDEKTMEPDMSKFAAAIDNNTIMVVASAPQYPHGVIDPIEAIAKLALENDVPMHVDACLGGFLLAFTEQSGIRDLPPFDFRVKGVTSISADTHKFGYAPKGSSVVMYSEKKYVHQQYFVSTDWSGGIFVSPTMAGSRSGGLIAATWAAMVNHGMDGYVASTKAVVETLNFIIKGIKDIEGLRILGNPRLCIVSFTSDIFPIYLLADHMKKKGWLLAALQYPSCVHLYVTPMHTQDGIKERFVADLAEVTEELMKHPHQKLEGRAAIYGMAQSIPDKGLVKEIAENFIDVMYTSSE